MLIATPFLDDHLLLRSGSARGAKLPRMMYEELVTLSGTGGPVPGWLADAASKSWGMDVQGASMEDAVLVRGRSPYGYCRASYELNLGCNFDCSHCYLAQKRYEGLPWKSRVRLLEAMRDAGVVWLQMTGGEPLIDKLFIETYSYAYELGMMLSVSSNASTLWQKKNIELFSQMRPYRLTISVYGGSEESFDGLTKRKGSWKNFNRGLRAGMDAGLPINLNLIITETCAHERQTMIDMAEEWGLPYHVFSNMSPTIYGGPDSLPAQSEEHLTKRSVFQGCHAGHTFFHADPHGRVTICKVGRDNPIDLVEEGVQGLAKLPAIADSLQLRTGGCSGCALSGTCRVCRPLAKLYQDAKAPLKMYCQHAKEESA